MSLKRSFPDKKVNFFIGFPFDPNVDRTKKKNTDYDKNNFLSSIVGGEKYFDPDEILLSSELWDFLSSELNTMDLILEIINKIATPDFYRKYQFIQQNENRQIEPENYLTILENWYLFSEIELLRKDKLIQNKLLSKSDQRNYNKTVFHELTNNNSTDYNWSRFYHLQKILF